MDQQLDPVNGSTTSSFDGMIVVRSREDLEELRKSRNPGVSDEFKGLVKRMWRVRTDLQLLSEGRRSTGAEIGDIEGWARVIAEVIWFCRTKRHPELDLYSFGEVASGLEIDIDQDTALAAIHAVCDVAEKKAAFGQRYMPLKGATIASLLVVTKADRAAFRIWSIPACDETPEQVAERRARTDRQRKADKRIADGKMTREQFRCMATEFRQHYLPEILSLRAEGKSYRAIADLFNARGEPTPSGFGKWAPQTVKRIEASHVVAEKGASHVVPNRTKTSVGTDRPVTLNREPEPEARAQADHENIGFRSVSSDQSFLGRQKPSHQDAVVVSLHKPKRDVLHVSSGDLVRRVQGHRQATDTPYLRAA